MLQESQVTVNPEAMPDRTGPDHHAHVTRLRVHARCFARLPTVKETPPFMFVTVSAQQQQESIVSYRTRWSRDWCVRKYAHPSTERGVWDSPHGPLGGESLVPYPLRHRVCIAGHSGGLGSICEMCPRCILLDR